MGEINDPEIIRIARQYGELRGAKALAEAMGYDERHARRFIDNPPKRINPRNRRLAVQELPRMVEEIEAEQARQAKAREALRRAAATAVDAGSRSGRGIENNGGKNKKPEKDAG